MHAPVCPYCKLPVEANDFSIGRTVYLHRECFRRRFRDLARNPQRALVGRRAALPVRWAAELALAKVESNARIAAMMAEREAIRAEHEALMRDLRQDAAAWRAELARAVFGEGSAHYLAHWEPDPASRAH